MNEDEDQHHPWCNLFLNPRKNCKICTMLFKLYPIEKSVEDMMEKYFPDVVKLK